jgi:hypothetical protein
MIGMEITRYNSDSGNGDLLIGLPRKSIDRNTPFIEVLQKASEKKAQLIVLTPPFRKHPGAWYIKGRADKYSYEEIKLKIEKNIEHTEHTTRTCYLIKYFD